MSLFARYAELGIRIHIYERGAKRSVEKGWVDRAQRGESLDKLEKQVGNKNFGALTGIETTQGFLDDVDLDSDEPYVNFAPVRLGCSMSSHLGLP